MRTLLFLPQKRPQIGSWEIALKTASTFFVLILVLPSLSYLGCSSTPKRSLETFSVPSGLSPSAKASWLEENLYRARAEGKEAQARLELGEAYLQSSRYELARGQLRRALYLSKDPQSRMKAQLWLGESYLREGDALNAETELRKALAESYRGRETETATGFLALALEHQNKNEEAERYRKQLGNSALARLYPIEQEIRTGWSRTVAITPVRPTQESPIQILPRRLWNPDPVRKNFDRMGKVSCMTIHHSGGDDYLDTSEAASKATIRSIQRDHQRSPEHLWADIGYHYIVDRAGRIWEGRDESMQGAHAGNGKANQGNLGICVLGNYDRQSLTSSQEEALRKLVLHLCSKHSIPLSGIYTHLEMKKIHTLAHTACPGRELQSFVNSLRRGTAFANSQNREKPVLLQTRFIKSR